MHQMREHFRVLGLGLVKAPIRERPLVKAPMRERPLVKAPIPERPTACKSTNVGAAACKMQKHFNNAGATPGRAARQSPPMRHSREHHVVVGGRR
jgi:hypothetical protein